MDRPHRCATCDCSLTMSEIAQADSAPLDYGQLCDECAAWLDIETNGPARELCPAADGPTALDFLKNPR